MRITLLFLLVCLFGLALAAETRRCHNCKKVVNDVVGNEVKSTAKALEKMTTICKKLPRNVRKECLEFLESNRDDIKEWMQNRVLGSHACEELHLCSRLPPLVENRSCRSCLRTTGKIIPNVAHNAEELKKPIHKVCSKLSKKYRHACEEFYDENSKKIVSLNDEGELGRTICETLSICVSKPCDSCLKLAKSFTKSLDSIFPSNMNSTMLKTLSGRICRNVGDHLNVVPRNCENLINTIADATEASSKTVHPEKMWCYEMGLCAKPLIFK
ncbi:hypothetical protein RCL1_003720 [Eukaryota sp. TZLM3-RCL]